MCLIVSRRHDFDRLCGIPIPMTHDKDILVFKGLMRGTYEMTSYNHQLSYSVYPSNHFQTPYMRTPVDFENGTAVLESEDMKISYDQIGRAVISTGIHTSRYIGIAFGYGDAFYSVIPAGTEFYVGTMSDIVSKKLVMFREVKDWEKYRAEHDVDPIDEVLGISKTEINTQDW